MMQKPLVIAAMLIGLAVPSGLLAQSGSATLQGTVTDPSGALVPNAKVHITSNLTGVARDALSNKDGLYAAPNLSAGVYTVSVSAPGFATKQEDNVLLAVGVVRNLDVSLSLSTASSTVTVQSSSNQVNTVDTSVQGFVDGKQTRDLPLNGRDWTTLATLNSGVSQIETQYAGAATATTRLSRGLGAQLTIGGNRPQQNSYRLDGVSINDYANGGPGSVSGATLGVDAVEEFNVIVSDAPAQYGRTSGGVINSITRQGTNAFHGSVYDFVRNSVFDARSYFDPLSGEPSFRRNQFGGTLGGPILHDRTFFFGNYEGFRQAQGISMQATVLSPNARTGLVTCTSGTSCNNGLQQLTLSPAVTPYLALYQAPNGSVKGNTGLFTYVTTQQSNEDFSTIRLDHNFSQMDSLHGTLLYDTASLDSADGTDTLYDEALSRRTTASLEEIHIFSSRMANSFRLGYNRSAATAPLVKSVLNPAVTNPALDYYDGRAVGQLIVSGLTTIQGGPGAVGINAFHFNAFQLADDATWVLGRHSITFGGAFERDQNNTSGGVLPNGEWSFGSINNFLTNIPQFFEGGTPSTPVVPHDLRQSLFAGYAQDSWKLVNWLTVNLGLRYEMVTDTTETANRLAALPTPAAPAAVSEKTFFSNNPTTKNFEPRVGVAWDIFHNGRTVFSAASGLYDTLPLNYLFQLQVISSAPSYEEGRVTYSGSAGKGLFPRSPFYSTTPLLRVIYTPREPPRSYVIQSNANLQQQITKNTVLQVGYVTSHGVHQIFNTNDINNVPYLGKNPAGSYYWPSLTAVTGAARAALTLNPAVGTESDSIFAGGSVYNSLQMSLSYTAPNGIVGKVAYTWSHSIDDSSSMVSGASFSNSDSGLPAFDFSLDRADSDFDLRQVFSGDAVVPLPNIRRGGRATSILRGWTFNNILSIRSGIPFTPVIGGDALGLLGSQPFDFPDRIVHNRSCTNGHSLDYVDLTCFAFPAPYTYAAGLSGPVLGTSRRNTLDGPGMFFWTTGLMKDQPITERVRLLLQAQAFNASNYTNFANPASAQNQFYNVSGALSTTAGVITGPTATPGRQLQFAAKVIF